MEQHIEMFASRISVLEADLSSIKAALTSNEGSMGRIFDERERLSAARLAGLIERLDTIDRRLDARRAPLEQVSVIASQIICLREHNAALINDTRENAALALAAVDKAIVVAQATADTALKKTELAATSQYLEAQIAGLRNETIAALVSQKEALTQAMAASDRAILKSENATEDRFKSVNEIRAMSNDMAQRLLPRIEGEQRFNSLQEAINRLDLYKASQTAVAAKDETDSRMTLALAGVVLSTLVAIASLAFNIFRASGHG